MNGAARIVAVAAVAVVLAWTTAAVADGVMLVRAGPFWMGADDGAPDEAPLHRAYVGDVWIDRDKVTNAEFAEFLNARGPLASSGERRFDWDDGDARIHRHGDRWTADAG